MKKPKLKYWFRNQWKSRYIEIDIFPKISISKLSWKDKFETPRVETEPAFYIYWLGFQFSWTSDNEEWEKYLWATKYSKTKDLSDWPWKSIRKYDFDASKKVFQNENKMI